MSAAGEGSSLSRQAKRVARGLARRLRDFGNADEPEGFDLDDVPSAEIALYFPDGPPKLYQLLQWLPVFEASPSLRTIVVLRNQDAYAEMAGRTKLPVILVPKYESLMALYDRADFRAVLYVNNGWTNFQSLAFQQAVHIHINHGESDKICMVSNQAKAYDRVFVAGEAAIRRHRAALAWFDDSRLVPVGRPQLDLDVKAPVRPVAGPTITYAPTWEGEDEANNYTSVDRYGVAIVEAALQQPGARVLYKPHPRVPASDDPGVRKAHREIVRRIEQSPGSAVLGNADVLGVIAATDLMIADVSSVSLDHLYLRPDAPLVLTDRRTDRAQLLADAPIAGACEVVDAESVGRLGETLASSLADDPLRSKRTEMRDLYFGGLGPGESTRRFWEALDAAIEEHDAAIKALSRVRVVVAPQQAVGS